MKKLFIALPAVAISIIARFLGVDLLVFISAIVAIVPLAGVIGDATEELAGQVGPRLGGFLNATLGNAAELIIGIFLVLAGELEIVKASIAGSIIGNVLLVLGLAFFFGGLRHGTQTFDPQISGLHSASLLLAVVGLMMPALFHSAVPDAQFVQTEAISIGVASVLIAAYVALLVYTFFGDARSTPAAHPGRESERSRRVALTMLVTSGVLVAVASEGLVATLETATEAIGLSELFVGLILVPVVGNAAEHSSAVLLARRGHVEIAVEIAAGSGTQIALFVAPALVFISLALGTPMDFFFSPFEIAAVGFSAGILGFISLDGRSNWLEGALLVAAYLIMGISFYFLPASVL